MGEIQPLPEGTASQVRSSILVSSLSHVVLGLFKNSLDSQAKSIDINVDFSRGYCSVEDNGCGIHPADFLETGGLGKMHYSSKSGSGAEMHGKDGALVSAVAALSILHITSLHESHDSVNSISFHHSRPLTRLSPVPEHQSIAGKLHGTKAVVQDLFGNMPVRVKQRPCGTGGLKVRQKEWSQLCRDIVGYLLAWGQRVSLIMRGTDKEHTLRIKHPFQTVVSGAPSAEPFLGSGSFDLNTIRKILVQGTSLDESKWALWVKTSARTKSWMIRGVLSLDPAPSKDTQFICIERRYIGVGHVYNILYDEINSLFASSSFGSQDEAALLESRGAQQHDETPYKSEIFATRQSRGPSKGVNRWPMFFIRIDQSSKESDHGAQLKSTESKPEFDREMTSIVNILQAMVTEFLINQQLMRPRRGLAKDKPDKVSPAFMDILKLQKGRPDNLVTPGRGQILEFSSPKKSLPEDSGLVSVSKLPVEHPKPRGPANGFSTWSRIKVGTNSNSRKRNITKSLPVDNGKREITVPKPLTLNHNHCEIPIENIGKNHCDPQGSWELDHPDGVLSWTDSRSKNTLLVNSRTGNILKPLGPNVDPAGQHGAPSLAHRLGLSRNGNLRRSISCPAMVSAAGDWADSFLGAWKNPIFKTAEECIPSLALDTGLRCATGLTRYSQKPISNPGSAFDVSAILVEIKLSKAQLKRAIVVNQVDNKFVLIRMRFEDPGAHSPGANANRGDLIILIDQHAADERIRVEALLTDLCRPPSERIKKLQSTLGFSSNIETIALADPIVLKIRESEHKLFLACAARFAKWGILYDLVRCTNSAVDGIQKPNAQDQHSSCKLVVTTLPEVIAERCRIERRYLEELMRAEAWSARESCSTRDDCNQVEYHEDAQLAGNWPLRIHDCPQGILDMANSRACRSAIMFNDELSLGECRDLVQKLAMCYFPFHCAHGRPSMIPVADLGSYQAAIHEAIGSNTDKVEKDRSFLKCWTEWDTKVTMTEETENIS